MLIYRVCHPVNRYAHEDLKFSKSFDDDYRKSLSNNISKYLEKPISKFTDNYLHRQKSVNRQREFLEDKEVENVRKSSPQKDFMAERTASDGREKYYYNEQQNGKKKSHHYFEDDGFDENIR